MDLNWTWIKMNVSLPKIKMLSHQVDDFHFYAEDCLHTIDDFSEAERPVLKTENIE